jgi:UDPglucose 6-dehydrogenase
MGASIQAFDPEGREARELLGGVDFKDDPYTAVTGADAMVIITEWDQFRALDLGRVAGLMRSKTVVDLRNIYRPDEMRRHGFSYASLGRK